MCPSFETILHNKIDRTKQLDNLSPLEEKYFKKYSEEINEGRLKLENFKDLEKTGEYAPGEIEKDIAYVDAIKSRESSGTKRGALLEGIISEQAELSNWFGQDSSLIFLSEYDDRMSHSDLLLEMESDKGEPVRLLVDVTTSVDESKIDEKISRSYDSLGGVKLGKVKYFESRMEELRGKLNGIPRVVIGINPGTLRDFCDNIREKNNRQEDNYIQLMLLEEIENQLAHMKEVLISNGKESGAAFSELSKSLGCIINLLEKKEDLRPLDYEKKVSGDKTYRLLRH